MIIYSVYLIGLLWVLNEFSERETVKTNQQISYYLWTITYSTSLTSTWRQPVLLLKEEKKTSNDIS